MNGPHDLGGQHGFGPVAPEPDEPLFHAEWERRAFALTLAMGATGAWNLDMSRHARERIPHVEYLSSSYYEIWIKGLQRLLAEHGLADPAEIKSGRSGRPPAPLSRRPTAAEVPAMLARGAPTERPPRTAARFAVGDLVRARNTNPAGHIRLPDYARGRIGRIERVHGVHVLPDSNAAGRGEDPRWLYGVVFEAQEIWGAEARPGDTLSLDLWEPYVERA